MIPSLAALAWGEPRRRAYWEQELLNALVIIDRGWGTPEEMNGSWAGAMGHTQWMPEVWLNMGFDYDGDGRVSPFGKPDDALGSTARYLVQRGKYRRGEHWGYEVRLAARAPSAGDASQSYAAWQKAGRDPRRRPGLSATRRDRALVGAGEGRAGLPARTELLCGALLQSFHELHALHRASGRPDHGRRAVRAEVSRQRARRPRWPRCRRSSAS